MIYVKNQWKSCETTNQSNFNQHASIKIAIQNDTINIVVIYRSPNSTRTNNDELIETLRAVNNPVIVLGDFNYPAANWSTLTGCTDSQTLIDFSLDKFWTQSVDFPTHKGGNILDLVFAEDGIVNEVRNDGQLGNSDHNVLIIETNHRYMYCPDANVRFNYSRADYEKIRKLFKEYNWREDTFLALLLKFADDTKIIKRIQTQVDNQDLQSIIYNSLDRNHHIAYFACSKRFSFYTYKI